jgi:hypothetical protein
LCLVVGVFGVASLNEEEGKEEERIRRGGVDEKTNERNNARTK